ncbi:MAG: hypothetical protein ACRDPJ_13060 [Nocardioidaceae bacterium]
MAAPVRWDDLDFRTFADRPLSDGSLRVLRYMCDIESHGIVTGPDHVRDVRLALGWRDRLAPLKQSLLANVVGEDFIATHMAWRAVNEWLTHAGYTALTKKERHPVLDEVLSRIAAQETRHIAFYASQARERVARSRKARRITRFALSRAWQPVGSGVMPDSEVRHLVRHLMGEDSGETARRIDAKIDTLPGLAGMHLVERRVNSLLRVVAGG